MEMITRASFLSFLIVSGNANHRFPIVSPPYRGKRMEMIREMKTRETIPAALGSNEGRNQTGDRKHGPIKFNAVQKGGAMAEQSTTLVREFLKSVIDRGGIVRVVDDRYVIEGIELSKRDVMLSGLLHKVALTHRQMVDAFLKDYQPGNGFLPVAHGEEDPWSED